MTRHNEHIILNPEPKRTQVQKEMSIRKLNADFEEDTDAVEVKVICKPINPLAESLKKLSL